MKKNVESTVESSFTVNARSPAFAGRYLYASAISLANFFALFLHASSLISFGRIEIEGASALIFAIPARKFVNNALLGAGDGKPG